MVKQAEGKADQLFPYSAHDENAWNCISAPTYAFMACFPSGLIWNYVSYRQLVGLPGRGISHVARPLPTQDDTNTEERRTSMPRVWIRTPIPLFERKKIFRALDRAATVPMPLGL
jgi:hypothetical protein